MTSADFGTVKFGRETFRLTEQAHPANKPLDVYPTYEAHGVGADGNSVLVRWEVKEEFIGWDAETERFYWMRDADVREEDLCDWDKPAHVRDAAFETVAIEILAGIDRKVELVRLIDPNRAFVLLGEYSKRHGHDIWTVLRAVRNKWGWSWNHVYDAAPIFYNRQEAIEHAVQADYRAAEPKQSVDHSGGEVVE